MGNLSNEAPAALAARRIRRVLSQPGLHAFEAAYDPWSRLPAHGHARPFLTYVLRGSFVERAGHHVRQCSRGAVIFHDQESHTEENRNRCYVPEWLLKELGITVEPNNS